MSLTEHYNLISGGTMGLLSRMFRLGRSTIHEILDETVPAIHMALKDEYLKVIKNGN